MRTVDRYFLIGLFSLFPILGWASTYNVVINTTSLIGTNALLAFDFIDGDGEINNTSQISNFLTDGSFDVDSASVFGDVTGNLNSIVRIGDNSDSFNELLQPIKLGNSLKFQWNSTNNITSGLAIPDSLSFFLLDTSEIPLLSTTDDSGSNALFLLDLTGEGNGNLTVFSATQPGPTWTVTLAPVPLPGAFWLMLLGGLSLIRRRKVL